MSVDSAARKTAEQKARLLMCLQKIPLFSDIPISALRKVLSISAKVTLDKGRLLCKKGDESNAMYILLSGKLDVFVDESTPVTTISPVNIIGEMGVFTEDVRSASVKAVDKSALFVLKKYDMNMLIRRDPEFGVKIMSKVIKILADRIKAENVIICDLKKHAPTPVECEEEEEELNFDLFTE